jgi:hypothetical protein
VLLRNKEKYMSLQLVKAHRSKAYLKLGMSAPSGGGKV